MFQLDDIALLVGALGNLNSAPFFLAKATFLLIFVSD